jgi:hypothetical protein
VLFRSHYSLAKHREAAEDGQNQDDRNQQVFPCKEFRGILEDRTF